MQVPMVKVHIVGHRTHLDQALDLLYRLGTVHLIDVAQDPDVRLPPLALDEDHVGRIEKLRYLRSRLDAVLALAPTQRPTGLTDEIDLDQVSADLDGSAPEVERLAQHLEALAAEADTLPRYLTSLRRLLPLVPELTELHGYEVVALLIDAGHARVLGDVNRHLTDLIGSNFAIVSDRVDAETMGAVLVFPKHERQEVQDLLGQEPVTRVHLPERFRGMPLQNAVNEMGRRIEEIPEEMESTSAALERLVAAHPQWPAARVLVEGKLDQLDAVGHLGATSHTFVLSGWLPKRDLAALGSALAAEIDGEAVVLEQDPLPGEEPPVLLTNPAPARPFEFLVQLLATPRYGAFDPAILMMIFLPLFFGMMLGDVGYGVILMALALGTRRTFRHRSKVASDLSNVLLLSSAWATVWGVIYAEFFGDLGRRLFDWHPLWIDREEGLEPLLLFTVAIGAAHVVLGLVLGVWGAARIHDRKQLTQRAAMLVALIGLFLVVGVAAGRLPAGFVTPAVAAIIVGLVLLIAAEGVLGLVTAPLELLGTVGNILSYIRIGAIGIASVYLARVANELGTTGPLWLGIVVASLFHALNVVLGAFSPTIQSLRLHYVEFFGKFYEEGGTEYVPFGGRPDPRAETRLSVNTERRK